MISRKASLAAKLISCLCLSLTLSCGGENVPGSQGMPQTTYCIENQECKNGCEEDYPYDACVANAGASGVGVEICDPIWEEREDCYWSPL